jgi:riboflavin kinase/FMN adenylyltransferase
METKNFFYNLKLNDIEHITIGKFDGMHLAHQHLISKLNKKSAVVLIDMNNFMLFSKNKNIELINKPTLIFNIDNIKNLDADGFIKLLKSNMPNIKKITIGYDFKFGYKRKYSSTDLKKLLDKLDVVDKFCVNNIPVHSKNIKKYLENSDFKTAKSLLGRDYSIFGVQIKGQGIGKEKLVATINIRNEIDTIIKNGVYVTKTIINNIVYPSISFLGNRSTDNNYSIETHIINKTITNQNNMMIEIKFIQKLRDNIQFENINKLKVQIKKDIKLAEDILNNETNSLDY